MQNKNLYKSVIANESTRNKEMNGNNSGKLNDDEGYKRGELHFKK